MSTLNVNKIADASGGVLAPISSVMRNRIINGAMVIDQRNAGASVTPSAATSTYTLDRWLGYASEASKYTVQQNAGSITPPVGFTNYLGCTSSSAYSVVSGDYFGIAQKIEGFNTADLAWGTANAKTVTLSFQVYSSLTGTFGGCLNNSAANRFYPFSYTISAANTWTTISVTIAGDTTGTWLTTNGQGIQVVFNLGYGSTYQGTANAWTSNIWYTPTGSVSILGTNGATFYITGVQLEVGTQATSFEYRQYQQELALCQRYCYVQSYALGGQAYTRFGVGQNASTTSALQYFTFPVTMRTVPTLTWNGLFSDMVGNTGTAASITSDGNATNLGSVVFTFSSGTVTSNALNSLRTDNSTTWRALFSSEL